MLTRLQEVFESVAASWDAELIEFNGEADHVHLLLSYPPQKLLSNLIANLKVTASKTMWREYADNISKLYSQKVFWTGSYFVASCGGVTIEQLKQYVDNQDCPDSSLGCHLGFPQMFICPVASIKLFAERCGSSFGLPQTLDKGG